jgi:hypothetical protein
MVEGPIVPRVTLKQSLKRPNRSAYYVDGNEILGKRREKTAENIRFDVLEILGIVLYPPFRFVKLTGRDNSNRKENTMAKSRKKKTPRRAKKATRRPMRKKARRASRPRKRTIRRVEKAPVPSEPQPMSTPTPTPAPTTMEPPIPEQGGTTPGGGMGG